MRLTNAMHKYVKWEYSDKKFKFTGLKYCVEGLNFFTYCETKQFKEFFHKVYPGIPFTELACFGAKEAFLDGESVYDFKLLGEYKKLPSGEFELI